MSATTQPTSASHRRVAKTTNPQAEVQPKKLPKAAVEVTAEAFLMMFRSLPGAVKSRIMELIDDYEDELDEQELAAARAANPEDFAPENAAPWEQVKAEMNTPKAPLIQEMPKQQAA